MLNKQEKSILQELPKVKEELEQNRQFLEQLKASQETVSEDRYQQLESKYRNKIDELEARQKEISTRFEQKRDELNITLSSLQKRRAETSNELNEVTQLKERGAISEEDYKQKSKHYNKTLKEIDREYSQIKSNLEEIDFYFNAKGEVNFYRRKAFRSVSKAKKNISKLFSEKGAFSLPKWSNNLTGQILSFSIILILCFFLPWAVSDHGLRGVSDSGLLWAWGVGSYLNQAENELREIGDEFQEELNSYRDDVEDIIPHNHLERLKIDKTENEIRTDLHRFSKLLRNFKWPTTIYPTFCLILGIILLVTIIVFSNKLTGWYPLLLTFGILLIYYIFSNLIQLIELKSLINQYIGNEQNPLFDSPSYGIKSFLLQSNALLNWSLLLIAFSGGMLMNKHKSLFLIKITLGFSLVLSLLYLLLPVKIADDKYMRIYWIIKMFKEQVSNGYLVLLITHLSLILLTPILAIIKLLNIKFHPLSNIHNEKFSRLIIWPIIFVMVSLAAFFTAINIKEFYIILTGFFYITLIGSFLFVWFIQMLSYVFNGLLNSVQKTIASS